MTPKLDKSSKKEFRYQFLGYEDIGTGKYTKSPLYGLGVVLGSKLPPSEDNYRMTEIKKTVAMVFDKEKGLVKQTEIEKL